RREGRASAASSASSRRQAGRAKAKASNPPRPFFPVPPWFQSSFRSSMAKGARPWRTGKAVILPVSRIPMVRGRRRRSAPIGIEGIVLVEEEVAQLHVGQSPFALAPLREAFHVQRLVAQYLPDGLGEQGVPRSRPQFVELAGETDGIKA